jgi:flagellar hook-associated protein 1
MSLFSILNTGTRGLAAAQMAMDVTGQNISNANVEGYSRKRLTLAADYRQDGSYGQIGIGVDIINIERMRDQFLDDQIRRQNQEVGVCEQYDATLNNIEKCFNEPSNSGLQYFMGQFFDGWQNLANNPSDLSARTVVKTNAELLTDQFHAMAVELGTLRQSQNDEIKKRIATVNELTEKISVLNGEIGRVEITHDKKANDSRDKRDELVKKLAGLLDINVVENARGQLTITTNGQLLVSPLDFEKLEAFTTTFTRPDGSQYADVSMRFVKTRHECRPQSGQIKGLFDSRDIIIPQYQDKLDALAAVLVQKINERHVQGYSLDGTTGLPFFDETKTSAATIRLSPAITSNVRNIAAASGGQAVAATTNALAAGGHDFGTPPVQLYRDPAAVPPIDAHNIVRGTLTVTDGTVTLTEDIDYHIDYVNGTFQMLHAGYDAANLTVDFQYRTGGFNGPGDNANALAIAQLREEQSMEPDPLGNPTFTFAEYYSSIVGQVGSDKNAAASNLDTRKFILEQYTADQDAVAGVSLDEEMSNMIKFQHSYEAAARIISVADKMLETLMNLG